MPETRYFVPSKNAQKPYLIWCVKFPIWMDRITIRDFSFRKGLIPAVGYNYKNNDVDSNDDN